MGKFAGDRTEMVARHHWLLVADICKYLAKRLKRRLKKEKKKKEKPPAPFLYQSLIPLIAALS